MAKGEITAQEGSFPLTRGKLDSENNLWEELRLISAHAGKTSATHGRHSDAQAHPRSRGENMRPYAARLNALGSSPLTRGKPVDAASPDRRRRLIPAHAGKTDIPDHWQGRRGAHPRSRGENHPLQAGTRRYHGSSPLTRGKRMVPAVPG